MCGVQGPHGSGCAWMESQCHDRAVIVGEGHCRVGVVQVEGVVTTEVCVLGWSHNVMIGQL